MVATEVKRDHRAKRIVGILLGRVRPAAGSAFQCALGRLYRQILLLWRTDEARPRAISVIDEVKGALYFVESVLLDALPTVHQALDDELRRWYPQRAWHVPPLLRMASWIGGDSGSDSAGRAASRFKSDA